MTKSDVKSVFRTIGVLGGGQLGRMMAQDVRRLGMKVVTLDPVEGSPAALVCDEQVVGDFKDAEQIARLAAKCDLLTVEIEHVNADALEEIGAKTGIAIEPTPACIRLIQDKYLQKQHLTAHNIPVAEYLAAADADAVRECGHRFGYPMMLKSRLLAYDGRGNAVVRSADDVEAAIASLVSDKLYVEKWCPFTKELAVMVVRSVDGSVTSYPVVETIQEDNICSVVVAPAPVSARVASAARALAEAAVASLSGAGVFGVELFVMPDERVVVNEIAPRPHNSGHYTIEACETSQFENHVRAIAGLPLGGTALKVGAAVMVNVLGKADADGGLEATWAMCGRALGVPGAAVHWYCKQGCKAKRKMGHITVVGTSLADAMAKRATIEGKSTGEAKQPLVGVIMGSDSDLPTMKACAEVSRVAGG